MKRIPLSQIEIIFLLFLLLKGKLHLCKSKQLELYNTLSKESLCTGQSSNTFMSIFKPFRELVYIQSYFIIVLYSKLYKAIRVSCLGNALAIEHARMAVQISKHGR